MFTSVLTWRIQMCPNFLSGSTKHCGIIQRYLTSKASRKDWIKLEESLLFALTRFDYCIFFFSGSSRPRAHLSHHIRLPNFADVQPREIWCTRVNLSWKGLLWYAMLLIPFIIGATTFRGSTPHVDFRLIFWKRFWNAQQQESWR